MGISASKCIRLCILLVNIYVVTVLVMFMILDSFPVQLGSKGGDSYRNIGQGRGEEGDAGGIGG